MRARLLDWYDSNRRELPWRRTRDPYAIWISETMLQQTRVETVIPYYERFLDRFPDVQTLADADSEDVYSMWAGLGYYSRAKNLHAAARTVVDQFEGELPNHADALRTLPGIDRYTAGAVASIAFGRTEAVVDGNVARVLSRVLGIREDIALREVAARLWAEAATLAIGERPGDLNQALMELGALVCTVRAPHCKACPLRRACDAYGVGDADELPIKRMQAKVQRIRAVAVWLRRGGRVLAVKRAAGGLLGGLWELPGGDLESREEPSAGATRLVDERLGLAIENLTTAGLVRHAFTHRDLSLYVFRADARPGRVRRSGFEQHRWLSAAAFERLARATVTRKAFAVLEKVS